MSLRRILFCSLAPIALIGQAASAEFRIHEAPDHPPDYLFAPAFSLKTPSGETQSFPALGGGKPLVLMFWPAWCPYSDSLQPYLQDIQNDYRSRGVKVQLVSVRRDADHDPVRLLREHRYDMPLLLDGDAVMPGYRVEYTPWVVVIDGERNIRYRRPPKPVSPVMTAQEIRLTLNEILGPQAVAIPHSYPSPESRGWRADMAAFSPLPTPADPRMQAPIALPEVLWAPWVENYLAGISPQETVPGLAPRGPVADGRAAIAIARELWTAQYGQAATEREAPYRAYRQDNQWLVLGAPPQRALGEGMVMVIEQDSGRVQRLAAGRALTAPAAATSPLAAAGPASAGTRR